MAIYSDINIQDPLNQTVIFDIESILQSIDMILSTPTGSRMFFPEFGINLEKFIFEPMTRAAEFSMKNEIIQKIRKFEERVEVNRNKSYVKSHYDRHQVDIFIVFEIKGFGGTEYVYQTKLEKNKKGQFYAI